MIKLFRVDDRLIHGQVAFAWTRATGTDHIIVVNDEAYSDNIKKMTLKLAKPAGTDLTIVPVSKFDKAYDKYKNKNLMILTASTEDAKNVAKQLPELNSICLGGLRPGEGKKTVASAISLSPEDFANLDEIIKSGINIVIQETPTSKKLNYSEL
jgi:fructoselysine and glucoselysine-specific PTS system IIB component